MDNDSTKAKTNRVIHVPKAMSLGDIATKALRQLYFPYVDSRSQRQVTITITVEEIQTP